MVSEGRTSLFHLQRMVALVAPQAVHPDIEIRLQRLGTPLPIETYFPAEDQAHGLWPSFSAEGQDYVKTVIMPLHDRVYLTNAYLARLQSDLQVKIQQQQELQRTIKSATMNIAQIKRRIATRWRILHQHQQRKLQRLTLARMRMAVTMPRRAAAAAHNLSSSPSSAEEDGDDILDEDSEESAV
jgi:hypothetical protein